MHAVGDRGIAVAAIAALLYNAGIVLQALEARATTGEEAWRPGLITGLVRRRRWVAGTVLGLLGWPVHAAALLLVPLSVVQPALGFGLVALLIAGALRLGDRVSRAEVGAVCGIVSGVAVLAAVAPAPRWSATTSATVALVLGCVGAGIAVTWLLARRWRAGSGAAAAVAGLCFAWSSLSTQLATDAFHHGRWAAVAGWTAACGVAGILGLIAEMTAFQRAAATRVAPIEFAVQVVVPVVVGPLIGTGAIAQGVVGISLGVVALTTVAAAAVLLLARSRTVEAAVDASVESSRDTGTEMKPKRASRRTKRTTAPGASALTRMISPGRGAP